ncbi:MAG TPA: DUF4232 domain-containing protein [Solirubrobacteraceae bacterium]|nr:DUF4232 domain-containing protein [Solirubrobacteraceae bacterium]
MRITPAGLALLAALAVVGCGGGGSTTIKNASGSGGASLSGSGSTHPPTTVTHTATAVASGAGAPGSTASGSGGAGLPATPAGGGHACVASALTLSFLGQQGATGHGELGFALRNIGSGSCSTVGYPGVQFLGGGDAALPTTPTHATSDFFGHTALRALTVEPGQTVSFRLGVTHGEGSSTGCTTASALQVIAPNDTATLTTPIPDGAAECATVTVSPLQAGDSAYP